MQRYANGICALERAECLTLLAGAGVGRIVYTEHALPAVHPVNYLLESGDTILTRTISGTTLAVPGRHQVVAFEVDHFDHTRLTGWSVVVTGYAYAPADIDEVRRLRQLPLPSWVMPDHSSNYLRIGCTLVSGRRIYTAP